ncbi:hypothetical protein P4H37_13755 [Paenibacillus thiaminolyticus]|uniref:hypothetical protein n=1 Tax=Paenibacillus thiaminolyticus TaxID=49283 RepID=UPI002DBB72D4|nr:hypothetical protein [Paenibacillus thiaminolyticus]MEC0064545.1 hypothetical protein [Paenibacillus thiaminolyticus]
MNVKKAIFATLIVSSMLSTLAGPIPAGAEAAQEKQQEQQQSDGKKVEIDKKMAAKLHKAVSQFAGKEIKLKEVAEDPAANIVEVKSIDGKYNVKFVPEHGIIMSIESETTIDKISKEDQDKVLKELKELYPKKKYVFNKEVPMSQSYDNQKEKLEDGVSYLLRGKDFSASLTKNDSSTNVGFIVIDIDKKELDPKLLKSAKEAIKTAFDHQFDVTKATLVNGSMSKPEWRFGDDKVSICVELKTGEVISIENQQGKKVTTNKGITEKEAKEAVAPLAKELFNIDITGSEVKWDSLIRYYRFIQNKVTKVRAALDADKNVVHIESGWLAALGD